MKHIENKECLDTVCGFTQVRGTASALGEGPAIVRTNTILHAGYSMQTFLYGFLASFPFSFFFFLHPRSKKRAIIFAFIGEPNSPHSLIALSPASVNQLR